MSNDAKMDKLLTMMESMMISVDRSIGSLRTEMNTKFSDVQTEMNDLRTEMKVNYEEIRHDIKGISEGVSFLMDRAEVAVVDRLQLESRVLKLEAEVHAVKIRLNIA